MIFSSIPFLYYFLPCVLLLYFMTPGKGKNAVLFVSSLFFYAWGEPRFVLVMLLSILSGYLFGILIEKRREEGFWAKLYLAVSIGLCLGVLGVCKYADFFIENLNRVSGFSVPFLKITLPIGISFYTFQMISYLVDVYRGKVSAQRNFIDLAAYITMFPQLIAGPIVRYADISEQLKSRTHSVDKCAWGIRRFLLGLGKKVLFANTLGELGALFHASNEKSVLYFWLYAVSCTLQIYFDFSGYSDMAIGLGKIFGFDFPENFNYPYISGSITEFWRRWHVSLGAWFRDYVYIPLGGNRVKKSRWLFNLLVVWFLTGLWHGAAWNFILWGLFYGVLLAAEKLWLSKGLEKAGILRHIYVMLAVVIGFVLFDAVSVGEAFSCMGALFGLGGVPLVSGEAVYELKSYGVLLGMGILGATPLFSVLLRKLRRNLQVKRILDVAEPVFLLLLLLIVTGYLVDGSFNPFLYFRF